MDLPNISISDFASQLIQEEVSKEGSQAFVSPSKGKQHQVDISNISLSDEETRKILEESFGFETETPTPNVESHKEEKRRLKEEFTATLAKLKELINEMTSVGMIGVNMAGHQKPKPKKKKKKKNVY